MDVVPIGLYALHFASPAMLPIPGTSSVAHLEENLAAASIRLTSDEFRTLASS
jgi:aryl-alcohol dehydrogenase-like predicted oxidoreductase